MIPNKKNSQQKSGHKITMKSLIIIEKHLRGKENAIFEQVITAVITFKGRDHSLCMSDIRYKTKHFLQE